MATSLVRIALLASATFALAAPAAAGGGTTSAAGTALEFVSTAPCASPAMVSILFDLPNDRVSLETDGACWAATQEFQFSTDCGGDPAKVFYCTQGGVSQIRWSIDGVGSFSYSLEAGGEFPLRVAMYGAVARS